MSNRNHYDPDHPDAEKADRSCGRDCTDTDNILMKWEGASFVRDRSKEKRRTATKQSRPENLVDTESQGQDAEDKIDDEAQMLHLHSFDTPEHDYLESEQGSSCSIC